MIKEVLVIDEGCEDVYELLNAKIANIEAEKEVEREQILADLDAKYEGRLEKFKASLATVCHTEAVEVEDEVVEEATEETEEVAEEVGE